MTDRTTALNDVPQSHLAGYMAEFGERFWTEQEYCRVVLSASDDVVFSRRQICALAGSVLLDIPSQLANVSDGPPLKLRLELAQRLNDELGLEQILAQWAVDEWCKCLPRSNYSIPTIKVTLVYVSQDPLGSRVCVQVANDTIINFTSTWFTFAAYDHSGHMTDTQDVCMRLAPGAEISKILDFDCYPVNLKRVVLEEFADHCDINGRDAYKCKPHERKALEEIVFVANSEVDQVLMQTQNIDLSAIFVDRMQHKTTDPIT